jgi:hypothetical protein
MAAVTNRLNASAAKSYVRPRVAIMGRFGVERRFDLGIKNGRVLHAFQAISFEVRKSLEKSIEATAFLAEEAMASEVPLTVVMAAPSTATSLYEDARKTLSSLKAKVVEESEFPELANKIALELAV